jgi:hypothetical protein
MDPLGVAGIDRSRAHVSAGHPDVAVAVEEVALRAGEQRGVDAEPAEPARPSPAAGDGPRVSAVDRPRLAPPAGHPQVTPAVEEVGLRAGVERGIYAGLAEAAGPSPGGDGLRIARVDRPGARLAPGDPDVAVAVEEVALRARVQRGVDPLLPEPGRPSPLGDGLRIAGVDGARALVPAGDPDVAVAVEEIALRAREQCGTDAHLNLPAEGPDGRSDATRSGSSSR